MAAKLEQRIPKFLRAWLPILTGALGTIVGAIGFYYTDVFLPGTAPINLSAQLIVRKAGVANNADDSKKSTAIELFVTATNPSSRNVYVLANFWRALGSNINTYLEETEEGKKWLDSANDAIANREQTNWGAHYRTSRTKLVGAGSIFSDYVLHPNESISRLLIFFVPQGAYDLLDVSVKLDTAAKANGAKVVRKLRSDGAVKTHIYLKRQSAFGEIAQRLGSIPPTGLVMMLTPFMRTTRREVEDMSEANLLDSTLQLQTSGSSRQLSLWQKEPVPTEIAKTPQTSPPEYEDSGKTMPSSDTAPN